jgi:hypothetical protein
MMTLFTVQNIRNDKCFLKKLAGIQALPPGIKQDKAFYQLRFSYLRRAQALEHKMYLVPDSYVQNIIVPAIMNKTNAPATLESILEIETENRTLKRDFVKDHTNTVLARKVMESTEICQCLRTMPKKIATAINRANFRLTGDDLSNGFDDAISLEENLLRSQKRIAKTGKQLSASTDNPFPLETMRLQ